jgi:localization factor PodJL
VELPAVKQVETQMKPGIPWSVKGIEPETREAAKDAARRSGMTLGEWLNSMILDSADGSETESVPLARHQRSTPQRDETSIRLEDIAEQLSRIARREQDTAPARSSYAHETRSEDNETLSKILNRVESNERQTVEAFSAVNERLAILGRQIVQSKPTTIVKQDDPAALKSLETAVRNIVEHIEVSEKRTRENLKSMQDRMGEMAQRTTVSNSEHVLQSAPAFTQLESRLSDLAGRVERSEAKPQTGLPDILRKELTQLTERIEFVRESSELLANKAQTAAVQTSQQELREIEKRILSLLKEAQSTFAGNGGSNAEIQKLRSEISTLNQRIDGTRNEAASGQDVHALRVALEQLSTRVAQGPDMRPIAAMDKRLSDITQRLEQSQNSVRNNPQVSELERRMAELDHRLNEAIQNKGDGQAQSALEQKISEVADRVGRTEHQLGHLETIERAINQLYESIEQSRTWSKDVAEDAANRMADRLMSAPPAAMQSTASSLELQALEDGLRAVRESAAGADKRNQETLEAVHETLEQIVEKLAELETSAVGQQVAAAVQTSLWNAEPAQSHDPVLNVFEQQNAPILQTPVAESEAAAEQNPLADWLEKSKTAADSEAPQDTAENSEKPLDDFIALARAAQAATQKGALGGMTPSSMKVGKSARKGFKLPFMKSKTTVEKVVTTAEKLAPQIKPAANSNTSNKRRTLLLAGLVLLAAVSAFTVNIMGKSSAPAPAGTQQTTKPSAQSNLIAPPAVAPVKNQSSIAVTDGILTGSLPGQKADATLASIVAQPGTMANTPEIPPAELGTEALRMAAERGDASAQFIIATRYLDGEGTTQDVTRAAHWYQKAAEAGSAPAQYRLATLFERGRGLPKDVATALVWYQRAAEQGNIKAMHNAAVIAAGTEAGAANYGVAFKWFLAASQNGLKDSQFNLAVLYERGLGTTKNTGEALFWYTIAASQNDADAQKRLDVLAKSQAPVTVDAIRLKALAWIPLQAPTNANVVTIKDASWQQPNTQAQAQPLIDSSAMPSDPIGKTQQLLTKLGFNIGEPDGKMGARTTNAIRLFQLQSGMKVTGEVNEELINQLQAKLG